MKTSLKTALILSTFVSANASALTYNIIDLGTLGGSPSIGYGVNASNQVAGTSRVTGTIDHAFFYNGSMNDIGKLPGGSHSNGRDINDSGLVTGYSNFTSGGLINHAFIYNTSTSAWTDLGTLGGIHSRGYGINNSASVTGESNTASGATHAFLYDGSTMNDIGTLGGSFSTGQTINDSGQVAGISTTSTGSTRAFFYDGTSMSDLGTLGGTFSRGYGINNSGHVTGESATTGAINPHAFLYDGSSMNDLGTLGGSDSIGYGVNAGGQVVGSSQITAGGPDFAFLHDGATMLDLCVISDCTMAGWTDLQVAYAINDNGAITGFGHIGGQTHAFLATPVPAPAAVWLMGSALLGLAGFRKNRAVA